MGLALLVIGLWCGCADVLFERGPYAIRALDVVYSGQEDMTFFVWRLPADADPGVVRFELLDRDGSYQPLDLDEAPFAADPYECEGERYLCFQYQVPGRYSYPEGGLPVRSIHDDEGIYAGSEPRHHTAAETFRLQPVSLGKNERIAPGRADWFQGAGIPMRRDWQWQLVPFAPVRPGGQPVDREQAWRLALPGMARFCGQPRGGWRSGPDGSADVEPPAGWVETPSCLAVRPVRTDGAGEAEVVSQPVMPAAELEWERQDYKPPESRPPTIYGYLVDLYVANEQRCAQIQQELVQTIDTQIKMRDPRAIALGVFRPVDPETGQELSGCNQQSRQDYPVHPMAEAAREAAARWDGPVRVVWIYMNNVELPPSLRVVQQLAELAQETQANNVVLFGWAVASNVILELFPWHEKTGWRPLSDRTFRGDLEAIVTSSIPFRTMLHDNETEIEINRPGLADPPRFFKICESSPRGVITGIGVQPGQADYDPDMTVPWPSAGLPHYRAVIAPQVLVRFREYGQKRITTEIEVCERFCDFPFRDRNATDHPGWRGSTACQRLPR